MPCPKSVDMRTGRDYTLDGLRGVAAMMVALSHIANLTWIPYVDGGEGAFWQHLLWRFGSPAVDMFIVLSGYVVAKSLLKTEARLPTYFASRFVRLLPIAWMAVIAGLILRALTGSPPSGATAYLQNLSQPLAYSDWIGFFTMLAPNPRSELVNPPLWTLVLEMQAVLLMPFLVVMAKKTAVWVLPLFFTIGAYALAFTLDWGYPLYFVGFALGAAFAVHEPRLPRLGTPRIILIFALAMLMTRHVTGFDSSLMRPLYAFSAIFVVYAIRAGAADFLLAAPFQILGRISYPFYALHWVVMAGMVFLIGEWASVPIAALIGLIMAIPAAIAAEKYIDRPAISWSHRMRNRC